MVPNQYDLDANKRQFTRTFGNITVVGTWFGKDKEPAIALLPTDLMGVRVIRPCVVLVSQAWLWAEETGEGDYVARMSISFADALGLDPHSVKDVVRVTSIVRECMGDLLTVKPKPIEDRVVTAQMIRETPDGKKHYSEVVENV